MSYFSIKTRIIFSDNAISDFFSFIKSRSLNKLAFVVDQNVIANPYVDDLLSNLQDNAFIITKVQTKKLVGEPTYDELDITTEKFRSLDIDAIVAIGGGSILDLAKGIGVMLKNPGKAIDYRGMDKVENKGVPVICFPTTAGTGSEVTHTASFIDMGSQTKLGINGRNVSPLCGVLKPELTFSCPPQVTISSGLDAMLHAVEAVSAKTANLITVMLGARAFGFLFANFKKVLSNPSDYFARETMLLGSYYAGIAMVNAGGGPASGISYPLGVHFGVPHGIAGGIFLPHVIQHNVTNGYIGYATIYDHLPGSDHSLPDIEKVYLFAEQFMDFYREIGAPRNLSSFKVSKNDLEELTRLTMEQRKDNLELNPISFGRDEVMKLIERVI